MMGFVAAEDAALFSLDAVLAAVDGEVARRDAERLIGHAAFAFGARCMSTALWATLRADEGSDTKRPAWRDEEEPVPCLPDSWARSRIVVRTDRSAPAPPADGAREQTPRPDAAFAAAAVSYTHLTLPTILLV